MCHDGEGTFDEQTRDGKMVSQIVSAAMKTALLVVLEAGSIFLVITKTQ